MADVVQHTWVDGEVITADLLNNLEGNAANAYALAKTNEEDLGTVQGTIEAIVQSDGEPKVRSSALDLGNGIQVNSSTSMLEVPIDTTVFAYSTTGITIVDGGIMTDLIADGAVYGDKIAVASSTDRGGVCISTDEIDGKAAVKLNGDDRIYVSAATSSTLGAVRPDNTTITVDDAGVLSAVASQLDAETLQTGTIISTFTGLTISDLRSLGGDLVEGIFTMTNTTSSAMTISAETTFITNLTLNAKSVSYTAYQMPDWDPLTLEVSSTGKALNFTTDLTIPASTSIHIYVVPNVSA